MDKIYLRAEAVNLANLIKDTEDLSTIRGSGLMILDLTGPVGRAIDRSGLATSKTQVTSGASQTVFRVELKADSLPQQLEAAVSAELRRDARLRFATVVVVVQAATDYATAREALLARTRWQQLRQSRISPAGLIPSPPTIPANADQDTSWRPWCAVDLVRPVAKTAENVRNEEKRGVGESVFVRRNFGFAEKQGFYEREVGWTPQADIAEKMRAAWDFHQIAQFDTGPESAKAYQDLPSVLNGKIALLYVDGNRFGKIQADKCTTEEAQAQWDQMCQGQRRKALQAILKQAWDQEHPDWTDPRWWNYSNPKEWRLRLETLLWGGDELLWVVPAWQGLQVAQTFFEAIERRQPAPAAELKRDHWGAPVSSQSRGIRNLDRKPSKGKETAVGQQHAEAKVDFGILTYSAGLVFCHAEAPIQRVWDLAHELAEEAKQAVHREANALSYTVLESFDQLGESLQAARLRQLPFSPSDEATDVAKRLTDTGQRLDRTVIRSEELAGLLKAIQWMKANFPRGSVYRILRVLRQDKWKTPFTTWFSRAMRDLPASERRHGAQYLDFFDLRTAKPGDELGRRLNWMHLAELWDYAVAGGDR